MIDLYTWATGNGRRASIALEECGFEYRVHPVDLGKGEQKTPAFLAINPAGAVPAIVDHEGPGGQPLTITQSGAILLYLAEKSGRFIPADPAARALTMQWFLQALTDVAPTSGTLFAVANFVPEKVASTIAFVEGRLKSAFATVDARLARSRCLAGEEVTVADLALYPVVFARKAMLVEGGAHPALLRWEAEMAARPALARGMKVPAAA
jgi:GST-like protein